MKRPDVENLVADTLRRMPRRECRTCDCFLGFLTQLELDAEDDVNDITRALKVPQARMHGCLGCNPCPPGAAFAAYLESIHRRWNSPMKVATREMIRLALASDETV